MSFYHILPSNVRSGTASRFTTFLENPYHLSGNWEMALMSMAHANCIHTFHYDRMVISESTHSRTVILPRQTFSKHSDALTFLHYVLNDNRFSFTIDADNYVSLTIKDDGVSISFDDNLRDIFALDKNTYNGKGTFAASGRFSLSRRIDYLYVYSNMGAHVRVGDTQAPLLAVLPFNTRACKPYHEHVFKYPMYVPLVHNRIAHIEIEIRDDAGQLVPFPGDSVTTLQLHFRPMQS